MRKNKKELSTNVYLLCIGWNKDFGQSLKYGQHSRF